MISSGGYKLNGSEVNSQSTQEIHKQVSARWGDDSYALMKVEKDGVFVGVTGVARQLVSSKPLTALSGRTILSPAIWGTSINTEIKLAVYGELFAHGLDRIEVIIALDNFRSLGSATKFGFSPAEIIVHPMADGGVKLFRRLRLDFSNWEKVQETNQTRIASKRAVLI